MNQILKEFGQLRDKALEVITAVLEEKKVVVLADRECEDGLPDEFYELPTQHYHRKYHIEHYHIWKLEITEGGVIAHGYDTDGDEDHIFHIDNDELNWDTLIELGNLLDDDPKRSYVILSSDNEWIATGSNETAENIAAHVAECKKRYPASELIIYYTNDSEVL